MNIQEMMRILDSIARDRNIDRSVLISDLEQAMVSAARKYFNTLDAEEFTCTLDPISGAFELRQHGEPLEMPPEDFGRIAAQTFKQVMIQRFRDDERASIQDEFGKRVGTVITGTAQRYDKGVLIVSIDRAEAVMLRNEQIPGEQFMPGDRVRALILDVKDVGSQVKIYISRAHQDFIRRLVEVEVPEVSERIIEIKAMAREAGYRTKVAVSSIDSRVDAVGACVGVRGSRIKNIVDELNGEKIDIVRWNESSQILIQNALKPAEVNEINLCFELGRATVVVRDDQLSLAIGQRGQNVRLASELTGWGIEIMSSSEEREKRKYEADEATELFRNTLDVDDELATLLCSEGFFSLEGFAYCPIEELACNEGFDTELAQELQTRARDALLNSALAGDTKEENDTAPELMKLPGINDAIAQALAGQEIRTVSDLADAAIDEIEEKMEGLSREQLEALIISAREASGWFE